MTFWDLFLRTQTTGKELYSHTWCLWKLVLLMAIDEITMNIHDNQSWQVRFSSRGRTPQFGCFFSMYQFASSRVFRSQCSVSDVLLVEPLAKFAKCHTSHSFGEGFCIIGVLDFGGWMLLDILFHGFHKWNFFNLLFSAISRCDLSVAACNLIIAPNVMCMQTCVIQNNPHVCAWCNVNLDFWVTLNVYDKSLPDRCARKTKHAYDGFSTQPCP